MKVIVCAGENVQSNMDVRDVMMGFEYGK